MSHANEGRFVWYQLNTSDPAAAEDFYTRLVGWGTEKWGGDGPTLFTHDGRPIAGTMQLPPEAEAPPHWLGYVAVADVDRSAADAVERGARVFVEPVSMDQIGRFAVLGDPQGALFALYTPEQPGEPLGPPENGLVSWHELATTDPEAAFEFYGALFGWRETAAHDMGEYGTYYEYGRPQDDYPIGGIYSKPAEMPGPPAFLYYVQVPSADDAARRVGELGGRVVNGPMDVPGGDRIAQATDPQGGFFAVHSRAGG